MKAHAKFHCTLLAHDLEAIAATIRCMQSTVVNYSFHQLVFHRGFPSLRYLNHARLSPQQCAQELKIEKSPVNKMYESSFLNEFTKAVRQFMMIRSNRAKVW